MSREKGSSKTDTLVKVVLVFFISLLSFSVGTFVGKQVSDSDHRRMALEGEYKGERSVASDSEHGQEAAAEHGEKITEKEVESLTEEFVNKEKSREPAEAKSAEHGEGHHADLSDDKDEAGYKTYQGRNTAAHGKTETAGDGHHGAEVKADHGGKADKADQHAASAAKTKVEHAADGAHKVAEKVAEGKAPSDGKKEMRKPQAVLPSVASSAVGKYAVQVASYAEEGEAKNHAADMKSKGYQAFYLSASVNGKTWYRVLVGLFDNVKNADEFRAQLIKDAGTKTAIVQKIVQ